MGISTEDFAARRLVKPESVVSRLCRFGHYFGAKPIKLPNGRLLWPDDEPAATVAPTTREPAAASKAAA